MTASSPIDSASHAHVSRCAITASRTSPTRSVFSTRVPRLGVDRELVVVDEEELRLRHQVAERDRAFLPDAQRVAEEVDVERVAEARPRDRQRAAPRAAARSRRRIHSPFIQSSFGVVERGGRVRDAVEVERGDDLVGVHHLAPVVGRPAEQREIVDAAPRGGSPRRGTPRATPRRDASRAWPGRDRGSAGRCAYTGRSGAPERARAARAPGAWSRAGPRPGSRA